MDAGSFKKHISERYGIELKDAVLEDRNGIVRVFSKSLMASKIKGSRGFPAHDGSTTHYFSTAFGHLAKKNSVNLDRSQLQALLSGKSLEKGLDDGEYIGTIGGRGCCTLISENGKIRAYLPELLKRNKIEK